MRVAILIEELRREGGSERQCLSMARELATIGHDVTVYTCAYEVGRCFPDLCAELDIKNVGFSPLSKLPLHPRVRDFFNMRRMASRVEGRFDVLNPHGWAVHWAAVWLRRKGAGAVCWMCNDYIYTTKDRPRPRGLLGSIASQVRRAVRAALHGIDRHFVQEIDEVLVLSNMAAEEVRQGYGVTPIVVRSGVDLEKFSQSSTGSPAVRERYDVGDAFLLLYVNLLFHFRRVEDVLESVAILRTEGRDVKLLVVGSLTFDAAYAQGVMRFVEEKGLSDTVVFTDAVPEHELRGFYNSCDVYVHPNEHQTWGLAVTEAMACGKPSVVSTGAGVHEVLRDGETAMLVPPRRPDLLAERIALLMDDPQLCERIGEQGRQYVQANHSWRRYAEQNLTVFRAALPQKIGSAALERA